MATNSQHETMEKSSAPVTNKTQHQRNTAAREFLHAWLADESGYDEETWPRLKQALEANRASQRGLFLD